MKRDMSIIVAANKDDAIINITKSGVYISPLSTVRLYNFYILV